MISRRIGRSRRQVPFGQVFGEFIPPDISGLKLWLRSDKGVTTVVSPVTAAGTAPPAVTITGSLTAGIAQTAAATPFVEIDITLTGIRGTATFTWKLNGVVQQTLQLTAATFVLGGTGLTANFPAGTYTSDNTFKVNINVSAWADQSSNGNDVLQAAGASQPTYSTTDSLFGNRPTVGFLGSSSQFLRTSSSIAQASPFTTIVVARSTVSNNQLCGSFASGNGAIIAQTSAWLYYAGSTISSSAIMSATPAVVAAVENTTSTIYVNNSSASVASGNAGVGALSSTYQLSGAAVSGYLTGAIAEVILYSSALSNAQLSSVFLYLGARYRILTS